MRVFFVTVGLVSAFLARGLCADLLQLGLTEHSLVSSEVVLAELRDVLSPRALCQPRRSKWMVSDLIRDLFDDLG